MNQEFSLELTAEVLERAANGLRRYRALVERVLGSTPEEVRETLGLMEGLTPDRIRAALKVYREMTPMEASTS